MQLLTSPIKKETHTLLNELRELDQLLTLAMSQNKC